MRFSIGIIRTALLIITSALLNPSILANAYWTRVSLRIEGSESKGTIFEGTVLTTGHIVTTDSGGTHECDGTNNGAHTTPGATIISAIDDAVSSWDGEWNKESRDYFITSIAEDSPTDGDSWGLLIRFRFADRGGCRSRVVADDQVLVALGALRASAFLEASVDKSTVGRGDEVVFTVVNGADKRPVEGATMRARATDPTATTNDQGKATITLQDAAVYKYKAKKDGTIRSNEVIVTAESRARENVR